MALSAYGPAVRCPVLNSRMVADSYAMSGTETAYDGTEPYAMSGTEMAYGTELAHGADQNRRAAGCSDRA
eukprot:2537338-Rhodomonas_salina.1